MTSTTSASSTTTAAPQQPTAINLSDYVVASVKRYNDKLLTVNLYGELNWGLSRQLDPNGANLRLRVYDANNFKTWLTGIFNSSPVGNSNNTIVRDIPAPGNINLAFILEPFGCKDPSCWDPFVWEKTDHTIFLPEKQYKTEKVGSEIRVMGELPKVEASSSLAPHTLNGLKMIETSGWMLVDEGYVDATGKVVITKRY